MSSLVWHIKAVQQRFLCCTASTSDPFHDETTYIQKWSPAAQSPQAKANGPTDTSSKALWHDVNPRFETFEVLMSVHSVQDSGLRVDLRFRFLSWLFFDDSGFMTSNL